jgi:hypothetical protein
VTPFISISRGPYVRPESGTGAKAQIKWRAKRSAGDAIQGRPRCKGFGVPLPAWQLHATAARIEEEMGNPEAAR